MNDLLNAIDDLVKEKGIPKEVLIEAIEMALVSAYKKNYGTAQNVRVEINAETGEYEVLMQKNVVEEVEDEFTEISLDEALEIDPRYQVGDIVEYQVTPENFGRIAAQTAKQVVVQRIREAERGMVFERYVGRQGELINGVVQRISNGTLFVNIGNTEGLLAAGERASNEKYKVNDRIKAYIMDVRKNAKGPQIFLSRTHPGFVEKLFELEVPEIEDGVVEIKSIAREAGSRTKIAVYAVDEDVDPVGACVGPGGSRVRNVVDELWGEKIDIIVWDEDPKVLISNALSPAKVEKVITNEDEKTATVVVPDYQLSLAIGRDGQNVRLAARLCGWKIDIKSSTQYSEMEEEFEENYEDYYDEEYDAFSEETQEPEEEYEDIEGESSEYDENVSYDIDETDNEITGQIDNMYEENTENYAGENEEEQESTEAVEYSEPEEKSDEAAADDGQTEPGDGIPSVEQYGEEEEAAAAASQLGDEPAEDTEPDEEDTVSSEDAVTIN